MTIKQISIFRIAFKKRQVAFCKIADDSGVVSFFAFSLICPAFGCVKFISLRNEPLVLRNSLFIR